MGRVAREAAKIVADCVRKMEEDLAKQGMTIDDWIAREKEKNRELAERRKQEEQKKQKGA